MSRTRQAAIAAVFCCMLLPVSVFAQVFTEDFTTLEYCDIGNTSAWWDTTVGEVKLPLFVMTAVGSLDTGGSTQGIVVAADVVYTSDHNNGLQAIDVSDPTNPVSLGGCDTDGSAIDLVLAGNIAYVANLQHDVAVVDISDPANPVKIGTAAAVDAEDVAIAGDHLFVTDGTNGLRVFDVSIPATPVEVGFCPGFDWCRDVKIAGDYAFVADVDSGLGVVDISDPAVPARVARVATVDRALGVDLAGDYAYVADFEAGLQVVDISDPLVPVLVGGTDTPGTAYRVTVDGDNAYVGDRHGGLQWFDVTDPTNPVWVGELPTTSYVWEAAISGCYAYLGNTDSGLRVVEIAEAVMPPQGRTWYDLPTGAGGITVEGNYAYIGMRSYGVYATDISNPLVPTVVSAYDTPGYAGRSVVAGDLLYLADEAAGLCILDISVPTSLTFVSTYDTTSSALDVAVAGDRAYVAFGTLGLIVLDIDDPAAPRFVGSYDTPGSALGVDLAGDIAYVADWNGDLQVIDISVPALPVLVGSLATPGDANDIQVVGDVAYLSADDMGLQVVDVSDPSSPILIGGYDTPNFAQSLAVAGNYLYLPNHAMGMYIFDISDPTSPAYQGLFDTGTYSRGVAVAGDYVFATDYYAGIHTISSFQRLYNSDGDHARSLDFVSGVEPLYDFRMFTTQTGTLDWQYNDGSGWQDVTPDGGWQELTMPIYNLAWRCDLLYQQVTLNPTCTEVRFEWILEYPFLKSVTDIPDDQGGRVRLTIQRSGLDDVDETGTPVSLYTIWRRLDGADARAAVRRADPATNRQLPPSLGDLPLVQWQERWFFRADQRGEMPPGIWEMVGSFGALQQDEYLAEATTLAGSTAGGSVWSIYCLTAHTTTPAVWFASPPDSGYSVDNIAPAVPEGFGVVYGLDNHLTWDPSSTNDFQYFRIYRSTSPGFEPSPDTLIHETVATSWQDELAGGWPYHYLITALDYAGNESEPAAPGTITGQEDTPLPERFALRQNAPNPFNPSTMIRYEVPIGGGVVRLEIFDARGRLVRRLVDGPQPAGCHRIVWRGEDVAGQLVATGIYFCRLRAPGYDGRLKMSLVR